MLAPDALVWWFLEPVDTWSLGDGRPNRAGEDQSDLGCLFPPTPFTVVGALRAAAARTLGWSGRPREPWPAALRARLGDGRDVGPLRFVGPLLAKDGEPLYPAPLHLLGRRDPDGAWHPTALLAPGPEVRCDLADEPVALPTVAVRAPDCEPISKATPLSDAWVTTRALAAILAGTLPEAGDIVGRDALFAFEPRVGIEREPGRRTVREGRLYRPRHVRLRPGVGLLVGVQGLDPELLPSVFPFGGESRLAAATPWSGPDPLALPVPAPEQGAALVALTPVRLAEAAVPGPGTPTASLVPGAPGRIVSACHERPVRLGGWDGVAQRPLPLAPHAPAGSVWFVSESLPDPWTSAGELPAWGFGLLVRGRLPSVPQPGAIA